VSLPTHRRKIQIVLAALCVFAAGASVAAQDEVIRVQTELVNLNVVVKDRQGKRVKGLTREDFEVYEDGVRQEITHFSADERPLRLVLLFDISISMEATLPTVKQAAVTLVDSLRVDDEVTIVSFAEQTLGLSAWLHKTEAGAVIRKITAEPHVQPVPATIFGPGYRVGDYNTYMYEAFRYVFENFQAGNDRIAIIMFTDGVDTAAGRGVPDIKRRVDGIGKEVIRQAQESWALVYPIRYKTDQIIGELPPAGRIPPFPVIRIGSAPEDPGRKLLEQITAASGGEVFQWSTRQDLLKAVGDALDDLRSQYSLGYKPPPEREGKSFRQTKVRVKRPNLVVRTREGYFSIESTRPRRVSNLPPP